MPSFSFFFLSVDVFSSLKETTDFLLFPSFLFQFYACLFIQFFSFLSFFHYAPHFLSLCSTALPVGVKLGECDRKERSAWPRNERLSKKREKRKADNEKHDLGCLRPIHHSSESGSIVCPSNEN